MWRVSFLIDWNTKRFAGGIRLPICELQKKTTLRAILDTYFPTPRRSYPKLFLLVENNFPPGPTPEPEEPLGSVVLPVSPELPLQSRSISPASELVFSQAGLSLQDSVPYPEPAGRTEIMLGRYIKDT